MKAGPACSFCNKSNENISYLIPSPWKPAAICDECVSVCVELICEHLSLESLPAESPVMAGVRDAKPSRAKAAK